MPACSQKRAGIAEGPDALRRQDQPIPALRGRHYLKLLRFLSRQLGEGQIMVVVTVMRTAKDARPISTVIATTPLNSPHWANDPCPDTKAQADEAGPQQSETSYP